MDDRHGRPYSAQAGRDLEDAPRVTAHDDIRPRREDACDLLALELGRDLGMREVVHARAATTTFRIGDLDERHAKGRAQQRARLLADLLPVREVAGVLIHDAQRTRRLQRRGLRDARSGHART